MLDRHDFEEWWARECARSSTGDPGPVAKYWAEAGFFASQTLMRNHVRNQHAQTRKTVGALLSKGAP